MACDLHDHITDNFIETEEHFNTKENIRIFTIGVADRRSARAKHVIAGTGSPWHCRNIRRAFDTVIDHCGCRGKFGSSVIHINSAIAKAPLQQTLRCIPHCLP